MAKKIQLKNGLSALLIESHKSPVVSVQIWVQTGSADENKGEEGVSHFIEHLLFKGTQNFGVGEIAHVVESSGGQINAYTSFDETVFYVTLSHAFTDKGLEVISEMMGSPKFDEKEIDNEREVVLEEIKRSFDDPQRQAIRNLFSTVYQYHPYGLPVIGSESVIRDIKRKELVDYFHARYVPCQMNLVVVGDFDIKDMEHKVEKYFGGLESRPLKLVEREPEPMQTEPRTQIVKSKFQETTLCLAWRIPEVRHKDIPALEVLSMVLGHGDSSRFSQSLRVERSLVRSVSLELFTSLDSGFFSIFLTLDKENLNNCLSCMTEELGNMKNKVPSQEEIDKAIINLQSEDFYSIETVSGWARKVGFYLHLFDDHEYHREYLKQVQEVTYFDVMRVFREYIRPKTLNFVFTTSDPNDEQRKGIQEWVKEFQEWYEKDCDVDVLMGSTPLERSHLEEKRQTPQIKWKKRTVHEGEFEKIDLQSGVHLILKPDYETPVVSMRCAVLGGLRAEKESEHGMTELLSRVWTAGTQELDEVRMYRKIDQLASSLNAFGGRNSIGLAMQTLSSFWENMYEIFEGVLLRPLLSEFAVEREKSVMLNVIKTRQDRPAQEALRVFHKGIFKNHPYSKDLYGNQSDISGLNERELRTFFKRSKGFRKSHVVVCGAIPQRDKIIESFNKSMSLFKEEPFNQMEDRVWDHEYPQSPKRLFVPFQKEQAHLVVGYPGLSFTDSRRYSLEVMQSVLSGQGGRLFIELRDKASLAYSVSTLRLDGIDAGYFGGYIACSPEKVKTAISMMINEFQKLSEKRISEQELEFSKRFLLGRHDIDLQRNSSVASAILFDEMYGLPYDETFNFAQRLSAVTAEDVRRLAEEIFSRPETLSLAGPLCPGSFVDVTKNHEFS